MSVTVEQIRTALIEPIEALRYERPRGLTAAKYKRGIGILLDRLRYLDGPELDQLSAQAMEIARDKRGFPAPGVILAAAELIRPDPERVREREAGIARWMRSEVGRTALAGDYAVEMLLTLRRSGPGITVGAREHDRWRSEAETRRRAEKRMARAYDTETDRARLAYWERLEREAAAMVTNEAALSAAIAGGSAR